MVDRRLILTFEGAPVCWGLTPGDIRARILEFFDDDADVLQVWEVPSHGIPSTGENISSRFAFDWARDFQFGDGIESRDYLAAFPAFVREHAREKLTARWEAWMAERDETFIPNPLRKRA